MNDMHAAACPLTERVLQSITRHQMISPGDTVYAAVSGGADSVFLLLALLDCRKQIPFRLEVVHVEHGLRGGESLQDAAFVRALCETHALPCHVMPVDVKKLLESRQLTEEEAARILRYEVFDALQGSDPSSRVRVALAHNMEDQAETVLFHLSRGSGLKGLSGMLPVRGRYIRPLLTISRAEIEAYLREAGQTWRTDSTNLDETYSRNRIRRQVLPVLTEHINARAVRHIAEAAARAAQAQAFLEKTADAFCRAHVTENGRETVIDLDAFQSEDKLIRETVLRMLLERIGGGAGLKDMQAVHIEDLLELCGKPRGKRLDLPGGFKALRRDRTLVLYRTQERFVRKKKTAVLLLSFLLLGAGLPAGINAYAEEDGKEALLQERMTEAFPEQETETLWEQETELPEEPVISLEDITFDPLIFFGDSRVVGMSMTGGSGYVAKVGAGYSWMSTDGAALLLSAMEQAPDADIVFCFGINDLGNVENYIAFFKSFAAAYPSRRFYFMSVNPVNEAVASANGYLVTNAQISAFNERLAQELPDQYLDISVFLEQYAITWDGLHYDSQTSALVQELAKIMVAATKADPSLFADGG